MQCNDKIAIYRSQLSIQMIRLCSSVGTAGVASLSTASRVPFRRVVLSINCQEASEAVELVVFTSSICRNVVVIDFVLCVMSSFFNRKT